MTHKRDLKTLLGIVAGIVLIAVAAVAYKAGQNRAFRTENPADAATENVHAANDEHVGAESDAHGHGAEEELIDEVTLTADAIQRNGIRLEPVRKQVLAETLTVPGRASYNLEQMAHVGTPVEGRIAEIKARLGDEVSKGDVLLVIDSAALGEAQSSFLQKQTQVQVAASTVEVARTAAERAKRLLEDKGIALGEYQRREGEHQIALGALKTAQAALTAAENNLHLLGTSEDEVKQLIATGEVNPRYSVRAPIGGRVVQRHATLGEVVKPEREDLFILADMRTLWILADVPENQIHRTALGTTATVAVDALNGRTFRGRVSYIAPELDKQTRTAQVRVEIEDGQTPLRPGMFAQVHLLLGTASETTRSATLAVPEAAVVTVEGGLAVFVEVDGEPGTFAKQSVKIGPCKGTLVPILGGLEEGKRVVVQGAFLLKAELVKSVMEGKTCSGH